MRRMVHTSMAEVPSVVKDIAIPFVPISAYADCTEAAVFRFLCPMAGLIHDILFVIESKRGAEACTGSITIARLDGSSMIQEVSIVGRYVEMDGSFSVEKGDRLIFKVEGMAQGYWVAAIFEAQGQSTIEVINEIPQTEKIDAEIVQAVPIIPDVVEEKSPLVQVEPKPPVVEDPIIPALDPIPEPPPYVEPVVEEEPIIKEEGVIKDIR